MSLILDALNKSRNDAEEVPGLGAEHYREEPPQPWLKYFAWAGLALVVLLLAWLLGSGDEQPEGSVVSPVAELSRTIGSAATSVTGQLQERADQGREKRAAQAPPAPQAAAPAVVEDEVADAVPAQDKATKAKPAAPLEQAGANRNSAAIKALYEKRQSGGQELLDRARRAKAAEEMARQAENPARSQARAQPAVREEPVDVEGVLRRAQQDVANAALVEHPAPFLVSLSQQTKNAIPTILYQRHDYSSQAGRSSVTLNGKKVRVGGTPAAGLKVDDILEDSAILSYRGTQFRLRALNSWVNL